MLMPMLSPYSEFQQNTYNFPLCLFLDIRTWVKNENLKTQIKNSLIQDLFKRQCLTNSKLIHANRKSMATKMTHLLKVYRL